MEGSQKQPICMNVLCRATTTREWKRGWVLRSGDFANLCHDCGRAYENLIFCDTFHKEESGWRECNLCSKHLHCGCVASKSSVQLLDYGGVGCINCARDLSLHQRSIQIQRDGISCKFGSSDDKIGSLWSTLVQHKPDNDVNEKNLRFNNIMVVNESKNWAQPHKGDKITSARKIKREEVTHSIQEDCTGFPDMTHLSVGSSNFAAPDNNIDALGVKSLSIALGSPLQSPNFVSPILAAGVEGKEQSKTPSPFQQGQRPRPILPKPANASLTIGLEPNKSFLHQGRVARPPAEGRGRNQLLPRYWPRITDQELQQLSGDLNSTIVPLFEKVLSASDAGRIGRLVLPKACAEAYFPPISQSEGLPLKIQDVKGKEWTFQFRFWPNNNSRMYVLEGVTPCIQSMQLQAGDTVTFSRIDPGGRLVMGFRKATNSFHMQDAQTSVLPSDAFSGDSFFPGDTENLNGVNGYSGLLQSLKGSKDPHLNALSERLTLSDGNINWKKKEKHGNKVIKDSLPQAALVQEKKRYRNIGSKSKRLLMLSEDAIELRLTWEEALDLLRPPPSVRPSIVMIENHEFEEYDEPPVFGKRTFFAAGSSGEQEQWAQCDNCSKWRRLPMDILLPPKWTCSENVWDLSRCSCPAPEDKRPKELENLCGVGKDSKKRKVIESHKVAQECEPTGLDALATAAVLGENVENMDEPSTTKHPRHRSGCTCIVCIQPPSGKGRHKSTCTCNVCMTVKRRFKTLMMRKKIRQSEREAETVPRTPSQAKDEPEVNGTSVPGMGINHDSDNERSKQSRVPVEGAETSSTGQIDLNCDPNREEELLQLQTEALGAKMTNLVQAASFPLEVYLKQNGLTSLIHEQQAGLGLCQATEERDQEQLPDQGVEGSPPSLVLERENEGESRFDEGYPEPDSD